MTPRYVVAIMMLLSVPPGIALWYAIHPFARWWRKIGPTATYLILLVPAFGLGAVLWRFRTPLLGTDLGLQPISLALALVSGVVAWRIARARRRHLTLRILVGVPELSTTDRGQLLTDGIYGRVRNPRYIEFMLFVIAYAGVANYSGLWLLTLLMFPAIHVIVLMEEAELRERFGTDYDEYCRRVPRWFPTTSTS